MSETASIHRHEGHEGDRSGIPSGALVACTEADYDDDKMCVWFTLPDLRNPECAAYLSDIGPALATIEIVERTEAPWGFAPADLADVPSAVERAEEQERHDAELMADPRLVEAVETLYAAGVTLEMFETMMKRLDDGYDS